MVFEVKKNGPEVRISPDIEALSRAVAVSIVERVHAGVSGGRTYSMALPGGKTPEMLYRFLSAEFRAEIPWERVHLFWGDERYVPPDDPRSNYGMAERSLLRHIPLPASNIHRMPTDFPEPDQAARAYEDILKSYFPSPWPGFDLVLLGLGEEGHTASLFPDSPALDEQQRWVVAVRAPAEPPLRLTLTLPALNHAECVYFLAAGQNKAAALLHAVTPSPEEAISPAARIRPVDGEVVWWADQAAAKDLIKFRNSQGKSQ